ncbi:hypothetical protein [Bradyrhizobium sp. WSM1417]|uniref:hypothetical protein n=1 Tax=Bradyrhizobium sp. WSM1417 TaxID=754500 RepID=UPI0004806A7D|nr:hypothetical protein [Bradyrhizobium sp. WSM1417]
MALFVDEAEMHQWLRDCFAGGQALGDLIENADALSGAAPSDPRQKRVFESFRYSLESLYVTEVISDDENISLKPGDELYPDFLLYGAETQSLIIVELKNLAGPTRQAGTELGAYAAEVRAYLPFLSDGDTINVVISTQWPVLLRHHILHEIFWMQRNIICLEPLERNGKRRLQVKSVGDFADAEAALEIGEHYIGGYQLCLYDDELRGDPADRNRLGAYKIQMKAAMLALANKGNAQKGHGFAFLWKDEWTESLAPYSITFGNFAPFQSADRFLLALSEDETPTEMQTRWIKIVSEFDPLGHGNSLDEIKEFGCSFLRPFCSPRAEGFTTWATLRKTMLDRGTPIAFQGWGTFESEFFEALRRKYEGGELDTPPDCPGLGLEVVDRLISLNYPRIDLTYYFYDPNDEEE